MMKSDHLTDPDSQRDNGLHHRETVSVDINGGVGANTNNNTNTARQRLSPAPQDRTRKPRRHMNFWERTSSGRVRLDVDEKNYAKYGKKSLVTKRAQLQRYILLGAICVASFILGYCWMHFNRSSEDESSSSSPQLTPQKLRGGKGKAATAQWKPRAETPPNPYAKLDSDKTQQHQQELGHEPRPNKLIIPRFDTRAFANMWENNVQNAALEQVIQKHPKSIELEGWNYPIAFRKFPYAKQTHGPIKNIDSDYGGLTYHSIKNEKRFGRVIPEDGEGGEAHGVVSGAFDADSIAPENSLHKRNKNKKKKDDSYPNFDSDGKKILYENPTKEELQHYFDDDHVKILPKANDGTKNSPRACQQSVISQLYFPVCNNFHAHDVGRVYDDPEKMLNQRPENEEYVKYLAHGYYRDAWVMEDGPWVWPDRYPKEKDVKVPKYGVLDEERTSEMVTKAYRSTVLKTLQMKHPFNDEQFQEMQLEAVIMERMTKSPRIMGIYGHCGFSMMVEVVPIEFEEVVVPGDGYESHEKVEKSNKDVLTPRNPFTATEKLGFALEMAESLADLHGFEDGVIVHDDVQLCQWLHDADGNLKLGDFNRATIMQWDNVKGEYCKFNNGEAFANYRAPEEFAVKNLNEQIDTFSFGNNIYAMLTGLWNFYDTDDDGVVQDKLIEGKQAYLDPRYRERSFAEKKLVELMEKCWIFNPDERISIFGAVDFLREAIKENEAQIKQSM